MINHATPPLEDRKQVEFHLAEAQWLGRIGSWAFDDRGFIHWSAELFAVHGLTPGTPPSVEEYVTLVHPEDREFFAQQMQELSVNPRDFDFTKRIVRSGGAIRYVRWVGLPAAHGRGLLGTAIDVTEQEELVDALRKSESELRQMLDFPPPARLRRRTRGRAHPHEPGGADIFRDDARRVEAGTPG
jgi:PAS domain-containing protein